MRKLWQCKDWTEYIHEKTRSGIRIYFDKNVDFEVRRACKEYIRWLRNYYEFPIRVPIYFKDTKYVKNSEGEESSALFFGPNQLTMELYIKISVGDYEDLLKDRDKDNALAAILCSVTHELTHYFQWIKYHETWLSGDKNNFFERQAVYYGREIVYDYAETREHP